MADVANTTAPAAAAAGDKKHAKPDEEAFKKALADAEKKHSENMAKFNAIKAKVQLAVPNKNKEEKTPTQKRKAELVAQVNEIRDKQGAGKNARTSKIDQLNRLDEQLKSRIAEQKTQRGKVNFKSVEELDHEIARLDQQVNTGLMKLVDEKKALAEISNLKKQRKNFAGFDNSQKGIDDVKAKIKEIKDGLNDPEQKALSEQYNALQTELDKIKAEQDEVFKNLGALRDEQTKLHQQQQESYAAMKKIKDDHYAAVRANKAHEAEARARARERRQAEQDKYNMDKKKARAQTLLQEASDPAYLEEIRRASTLLRFFDPDTPASEKSSLLANKGLGAEATRKVDDTGFKGMKVVSKKDDVEFIPSKSKGKKSKKSSTPAAASKNGFSCPPSVMEDCSSLGVTPPMTADDVSATVEEIKKKLSHWQQDQAAQTQRVSFHQEFAPEDARLISL